MLWSDKIYIQVVLFRGKHGTFFSIIACGLFINIIINSVNKFRLPYIIQQNNKNWVTDGTRNSNVNPLFPKDDKYYLHLFQHFLSRQPNKWKSEMLTRRSKIHYNHIFLRNTWIALSHTSYILIHRVTRG